MSAPESRQNTSSTPAAASFGSSRAISAVSRATT
jgi:hypothetical protein